jgi:hypothetical protein
MSLPETLFDYEAISPPALVASGRPRHLALNLLRNHGRETPLEEDHQVHWMTASTRTR